MTLIVRVQQHFEVFFFVGPVTLTVCGSKDVLWVDVQYAYHPHHPEPMIAVMTSGSLCTRFKKDVV